MPNFRLMTAQETLNRAVQLHPMLYAGSSVSQTRLLVFDQIFNVIGNGYRNQKEFDAGFRVAPSVRAKFQTAPNKYVEGKTLYVGYTRATPMFDKDTALEGKPNPMRADFNSALPGAYTEEEKQFFPEVQLWRALRVSPEWVPYPNFKPEYSLLYKIDLGKLDPAWLEEGIDFYRSAKAFFEGPNSHLYHTAWPQDKGKQERLVADFAEAFAKYVAESPNQQEQNQLISEAYEFPYRGDIPAFIQERWDAEKTRIVGFIDATVARLEAELLLRNKAAMPTP